MKKQIKKVYTNDSVYGLIGSILTVSCIVFSSYLVGVFTATSKATTCTIVKDKSKVSLICSDKRKVTISNNEACYIDYTEHKLNIMCSDGSTYSK